MTSLRPRRHLVLAAISLTLPLVAFSTNGYFAEGYGVRAESLAGATTALSLDALTIASNPAGLSGLKDGWDLGVDVFVPDRGASLVQGGQSAHFSGNDTRLFLIPAIGVNGHISPDVAWGVGVFGNGGLNTDYAQNPFARFGAQGAGGVNLSQAFLSPALSWSYTKNQSIGLALNVVYQQFEAKGLQPFAAFSIAPSDFTNRGKDTATGIGGRIGWRAQFPNGFSLGATWQPKTSVGKFKKYAGLFADGGSFDVPQTWAVGLGWRPSESLQLSLDAQRIDYAGVHSVGNSINSLFFGAPLGSANGPGFGWRNITVLKAGVQYRVNTAWIVRAGYSHGDQPVPQSQTLFNILAPGVVQDHLTLGAEVSAGAAGSVTFSYQHAFSTTVHGAGSIPPSFGGGNADIALGENAFGIGYSRRL
jgi:long-chain fatty acid transport protein